MVNGAEPKSRCTETLLLSDSLSHSLRIKESEGRKDSKNHTVSDIQVLCEENEAQWLTIHWLAKRYTVFTTLFCVDSGVFPLWSLHPSSERKESIAPNGLPNASSRRTAWTWRDLLGFWKQCRSGSERWWHGVWLSKVASVCAPKIRALDHIYVKTCLNFKGRNRPTIWGLVEGKASYSLEKVNKGRLLAHIPLYFSFVSGICRVAAFFMGLPGGR